MIETKIQIKKMRPYNIEEVGKIISDWKEVKGNSVAELAKEVGCTRSTIYDIINNRGQDFGFNLINKIMQHIGREQFTVISE